MPQKSRTDTYLYTGPDHIVKRVATAASAQGSVLNLVAPASNASRTSNFEGPVLRCENLSTPEQLLTQETIATWLTGNSTHCWQQWSYKIWYGRFPEDLSENQDGTAAAFRLAVLPKMFRYSQANPGIPLVCEYRDEKLLSRNASAPLDDLADDSTLLECKLFRSTYHVDFNFTGGQQSLEISVPVTNRDAPILFSSAVIGPNNASCAGLQHPTWDFNSRPWATLSSCDFNETV
jgi:hypothetical protein